MTFSRQYVEDINTAAFSAIDKFNRRKSRLLTTAGIELMMTDHTPHEVCEFLRQHLSVIEEYDFGPPDELDITFVGQLELPECTSVSATPQSWRVARYVWASVNFMTVVVILVMLSFVAPIAL